MKDDEKTKTMADLMKDFFLGLSSSSAVLITILVGIYTYSVKNSNFPNLLVLYSSILYLVAVVSGILAYGSLISLVHNKEDPWSSWVRIPSFVQWCAFILATSIMVYVLYILVTSGFK